MKQSIVFSLLLASISPLSSTARSWSDVVTYHDLDPVYYNAVDQIAERDPMFFTMSPSQAPSKSPSLGPTNRPTITSQPSEAPSGGPTGLPTPSPTISPSSSPSLSPTTSSPTGSPTQDPYTPPDPPASDDGVYFNYDTRISASYGPGYAELVQINSTTNAMEYQNNAWATRSVPSDWYWKEFDSSSSSIWADVLSKYDPGTNQCDNIGTQSPIDIRETGAICFEHHQIRTRSGGLSISDDTQIEKLIESNKLRLKFARRACRDSFLPECATPDPPQADFPNNWGNWTDLMHIDFKVPSEHTIYGERFDGEMQVYHLHAGRRRTPTVVAMMKASSTGYNPMLQQALDEFQSAFNINSALCASRIRRRRRLVSKMHKILGKDTKSEYDDYNTWGDFSTKLEEPGYNATGRSLQSTGWSPHNDLLLPSLYFWIYNGSLTEPPCSEWVTWYITDIPMTMSFEQLAQIKSLIFTHVDSNCVPTSGHYHSSVARPIQDTFGRPIVRCTQYDFAPDNDGERNFS